MSHAHMSYQNAIPPPSGSAAQELRNALQARRREVRDLQHLPNNGPTSALSTAVSNSTYLPSSTRAPFIPCASLPVRAPAQGEDSQGSKPRRRLPQPIRMAPNPNPTVAVEQRNHRYNVSESDINAAISATTLSDEVRQGIEMPSIPVSSGPSIAPPNTMATRPSSSASLRSVPSIEGMCKVSPATSDPALPQG